MDGLADRRSVGRAVGRSVGRTDGRTHECVMDGWMRDCVCVCVRARARARACVCVVCVCGADTSRCVCGVGVCRCGLSHTSAAAATAAATSTQTRRASECTQARRDGGRGGQRTHVVGRRQPPCSAGAIVAVGGDVNSNPRGGRGASERPAGAGAAGPVVAGPCCIAGWSRRVLNYAVGTSET